MSYFKVINLAVVALYAIGSGYWVSAGDTWYRNLNAPNWQPPDWVFGVIWPYNFTVLAITGWWITSRVSFKVNLTWSSIFLATVLTALFWSYKFYVPHHLKTASISLILAAVGTLPLTFLAFRSNIYLGLALLPYQIWVSLASVLSYNYWKLN